MHYESPWSFLLLLVVPVLLWLRRHSVRNSTIRFPATDHAVAAGNSWRRKLRWFPMLMRALALVCLIFALARPQRGIERIRDVNHGIAIMMVLDRSTSMAQEMKYGGEQLNRFEAAKRIFRDFVLGNGRALPGRPNDLVGMIAFARYPDTVCPLTLAHGVLPRFLDTAFLADRQSEDGTAIGDALALAAARLKTAEETLARQAAGRAGRRKDYDIKSKVIILLTDGENNAGKRSPQEAARLAAEWGMKVYAIGIGGTGGAVFQTPFGSFQVPGSQRDDSVLQGVAETTKGRYWKAEDAESLLAVYKEIDRLEKSEIESVRFIDYREKFPAPAIAGLCFLLVEVLSGATLFRRIP